MLIYILDMFGTAIFAISGVLLAGRLRMDPFGVVVLASVTAIGGGTIRDMALGATPVFWIHDTNYLWVIFITCIVSMWALRFGASPMVAVIMGVITGCGGGVIRDVLAREVPMVLRTEVYATACILGGIIHTSALSLGVHADVAAFAGIITTLTIRLAAIRWHLSLPAFALRSS